MAASAVLAFYFLFASPVAEIREKERTPDFDRTGITYHEKYSDIIAPECVPFTHHRDLPWAQGDSLQYVKANKVRVMNCDHYSTERFSEHHVWQFNEKGLLTHYAIHNSVASTKAYYTKDYSYDPDGFITGASKYQLEDGISKQYRGYEQTSTFIYKWSAGHTVCDVTAKGELISLPGTSKSYRNAWDRAWSSKEHWEFNGKQQPVLYRGTHDDHQCEILFSYDAENRLTNRAVRFTDCDGGFADSMAWTSSGGILKGEHYFALIGKKHREFLVLLETAEFDGWGNLLALSREPGVTFNREEEKMQGGNLSCAYFHRDVLDAMETDSVNSFVTHRRFMYQVIDSRIVVSNLWLRGDSLGEATDTLRLITVNKQANGLVNFIDVKNYKTWFKGTWNCAAYHDMDQKCTWEFTYEFY